MITIGIFGPSNDQEVEALRKRLLNRGVKPIVIDLSGFPEGDYLLPSPGMISSLMITACLISMQPF